MAFKRFNFAQSDNAQSAAQSAQFSLPGVEPPATPRQGGFGKSAATTSRYVPPAKFSDEQNEIIHCPAPVVAGQAFAGTGKSTTGIGYAMHHQDKSILVLCFNRANAIEAAEKYPSVGNHATVATTHAVARRSLTPQMSARVATRWGSVTLRGELPLVGARADMRTAAITANILRDFFMSAEEKIDPYLHGKTARKENRASEAAIEQCCEYAWRLWLAMNTEQVLPFMKGVNGVNPISIPHDAYLKRFVMMGRNLGYDSVIFDEAQDANPIMLKLLADQYKTGSHVLMLGDRHQAIYEFRGAVNAMEELPDGAKVLPLTQSWRFGPKTAQLANLLLGELKGEKLQIQGLGQDGWYDKTKHKLTYLSRTNADLIGRAVSVEGEGVYWVGGIDGYRVSILNDAWALRKGRLSDINDPYIRKNFNSWTDFEEAAEVDAEVKIIVGLVEQYAEAIPGLVEKLHTNAATSQEDAEMTLSTGHKSKGLEWDYVKICDDFKSAPLETAEKWLAGDDDVSFPTQEINLLYVLSTRSKKGLIPNREIKEWRSSLDVHRRNRVRTWRSEMNQEDAQAQSDPEPPRASPFARVAPFSARPR